VAAKHRYCCYCGVDADAVAAAGDSGRVIRMPRSQAASAPLTVQLYSRTVSSRLSATDPLCFYFRYYIDGGVGGVMSVLTMDNAGNTTLQSTVYGQVMMQWHFSFVEIHSASGPFQVAASASFAHNTALF